MGGTWDMPTTSHTEVGLRLIQYLFISFRNFSQDKGKYKFNSNCLLNRMVDDAYDFKVDLDETEKVDDTVSQQKSKGTLHECNQCGYAVTRKETLKRHIQYEHEGAEWKYKCDRCSKRFKDRESLNVHVRCYHEKAPLKCKEEGCDAVYWSRCGLRDHKYKVHDCREVFCKECDFKSHKQYLVTKHYKQEHLRIRIQYKCAQCEYSTRFKSCLDEHNASKHKILRKRARRIDSPDDENDISRIHKCNLCEFTTSNSHFLKSHMDAIHGEKKKCNQCEKSFKWVQDLEKHIKAVHQGMKKKCSLCEFQTNYNQNLKGHMKAIHGISKYKCEICNKLFNGNFDLQIHISGFHEGKSSKCNQCDYTYESYDSFRTHKIKHKDKYSGIFNAATISRRRQKNRQLKKDSIVKAEKDVEKSNEIELSYACQFCDKEFGSSKEMVHHIASHI